MKIYSLSEQALARARRQLTLRMIPMFAVVAAIVLVVSVVQGGGNWLVLLMSIPLLVAILGISFYRGIKSQQEIWRSVRVELGEDYVARSQIRVPQVRIERAQIVSIEELGGSLCIRTTDKYRTLAIPPELDSADFEEIKATLSAWVPVREPAPATGAKNALLYVILLVGFGVIAFSQTLWVVIVVGVLIFAYYLYILWQLQKSVGVDPQFRRSLFISTAFIALLTIGKVFFLVAGSMLVGAP